MATKGCYEDKLLLLGVVFPNPKLSGPLRKWSNNIFTKYEIAS